LRCAAGTADRAAEGRTLARKRVRDRRRPRAASGRQPVFGVAGAAVASGCLVGQVHVIYRLGDKLAVRLPRAPEFSAALEREVSIRSAVEEGFACRYGRGASGNSGPPETGSGSVVMVVETATVEVVVSRSAAVVAGIAVVDSEASPSPAAVEAGSAPHAVSTSPNWTPAIGTFVALSMRRN
jgi:hypothetical protein